MYKAVINALTMSVNAQGRKWFQATVILGALMVGFSISAQGDYLNELEAEAADTGSLKKNNNPSPPKTSNIKSDIKEKFEKLLEFELPSTYKFYTKLTSQDQDKVVQHYSQHNKMSSASKMIFDLYFESNKKK